MNMGLPIENPTRYTVSEYLRMEEDSLEKHEYRDGQIVAMAGGSVSHSTITINLIGSLLPALRGKTCRLYDSNLRLRIPRTPLYTYPDASIVCGGLQLDPNDSSGGTFLNPRVLFEVLSPSTEAYDRGEKFRRYRQIESLEEYVLLNQDGPRVETFYRQPEGTWLVTFAVGLESRIRLRSVEIDLALSQLYAGVEFPPAEPTEPAG